MARTREFDPSDALNSAMGVFWKKGYFDTSVDDLVAATGVSRYGLYGEFGNKRGLFLATLDHYQSTITHSLLSIIGQPHASLTEIRNFFGYLLQASSDPRANWGCLMCNTANEVAPHESAVAEKVRAFHKKLSTSFFRALENAIAKGELRSTFDTKREADFLVGVVHAVSAFNRCGEKKNRIKNMISVALETLE